MAQRGLPAAAHPWPLVGRDLELETLGAAFDDPECHGVGLVGAAGVGKTRLARAAADLGASRGMTAVTIRATATASEIPFAALTPLFLELDVDPSSAEQPVHAVIDAVKRRPRHDPLVLVIDDAPDLDASSRAVVDQLVGVAGTFLVLTVREGSSTGPPSYRLWTDDHVLRLPVGPLPATELSALVQVALDGPVDGATLRSLTEACQGNLLLLRELVLGSLESGALATRHGIWRLSGSLADSPRLHQLIDHRLQGVTAAEQQALELIALGEPLGAALFAETVPPEVVESLERAGLIESAREEGQVELRFTHPLYAEVVSARLSVARKENLYRLLADGIERSGPLSPQQSLRVAVWRLEGGASDPVGAVAAARLAFRRKDFGLAARLARAAWEASGEVESAILLSDSLDLYGQSDEVEKVMLDAYPKAVTDADVTALAVRHASALYRWSDRAQEADDVLTVAAERVTDPSCRRMIEAQRGAHFLRSGDMARAIAIDLPLLDDHSDAAFVQASLNVGVALSLAGRSTEAIRHLDAFAALTEGPASLPDAPVADALTTARVHALVESGNMAEALAVARAGYAVVLERGHLDGRAWIGCVVGGALVTQGKLRSSEDAYREASALFGELGHPGERWALAGVAFAAGQSGRAQAAAEAASAMEAVDPSAWAMMDVYVDRGRAWSAVANGELARAAAILWELVGYAEIGGQLAASATALHDLVRITEDRQAAEHLVQLGPRVEGALMGARATCARAVLAGDPALAAGAAEQFEHCGALLFAAEAAALEQRLAAEAGLRRRATEAGRRASRLAALCEGPRTPPLRSAAEEVRLSAREREVALMAAEGLNNRTIADKLVLSKRTVENHLQRVYTKFGVSSRADLAAALGGPAEGSEPAP